MQNHVIDFDQWRADFEQCMKESCMLNNDSSDDRDFADNQIVSLLNTISRNLVTLYLKYCILIGYRTRYLSGDT